MTTLTCDVIGIRKLSERRGERMMFRRSVTMLLNPRLFRTLFVAFCIVAAGPRKQIIGNQIQFPLLF